MVTSQIRVLVLEDRVEDAELMIRELQLGGYDTEWRRVETEADFLSVLEWRPDLILADFSLPQYGAIRALRLLQQREVHVPFIVVTGTVGEETVAEVMKDGATDYILKDRLTRLPSAVAQAMEKKRLGDEHLKTLKALRDSESRYRALIANLPVIVWTVDELGRLEFVSPNVATISGYSQDEMLGADRSWLLERVHAEDELVVRQNIETTPVEQHDVEFEFRFRHRDGHWIWLQNRGLATYRLSGSTISGGVIADVTERKKLEEQLRQGQRMEAIGRLAGGIAHDFNNLLTVITGYSQMVIGRLRPDDPLSSDLSEVCAASDRAAALTRQLLAFSRKQMLQPRVLNLNSTVSEMVRMLERLIGEDIHLKLVLDEDLDNTRADPAQIEQVVANLVVNARDAMPHGGILTIETRNVVLDDAYAASHVGVSPGAYVLIGVSDTGEGMEPETQSRIFEPFYTTKSEGHGTGLGLSTVYGIVKQSGGSISVYSEPGIGTSFEIYLPSVSDGVTLEEQREQSLQVPVGTETVLLTEDDVDVRRIAAFVLRESGYRVLEASNGGDAVLLGETHDGPIDLLLTDVVMPNMSGRVLADTLAPLRPELRVLFMSGYTENAIVHHGLVDESVQFIHKPFSPEGLLREVRRVIDGPRPPKG